MKRRRFLQALSTAPAVPALVQQSDAQQVPATVPAPAEPGRSGRGGATGQVPHIPVGTPDDSADTVAKFFTAGQFATLRKLAGILVPPVKGNVGALDTDAPEFLDFLIGVSPAETQTLYRNGLDGLNASARRKFAKVFSEIDAKQADEILKPLLVQVPWVYDLPKDPMKHFVYQVHSDLRTATRNSPEANKALASTGRRGGGGAGLYWNPIDPV